MLDLFSDNLFFSARERIPMYAFWIVCYSIGARLVERIASYRPVEGNDYINNMQGNGHLREVEESSSLQIIQ